MNGTDILTAAVEGGIGYWSEVVDAKRDKDLGWKRVTLAPSLDLIVNEEVGDEWPADRKVVVTAGDCTAAAKRIVKEKLANDRIIGYITGDDIDADAADCIVQVAVFGEIVYG